jgi:hypothetical protein
MVLFGRICRIMKILIDFSKMGRLQALQEAYAKRATLRFAILAWHK